VLGHPAAHFSGQLSDFLNSVLINVEKAGMDKFMADKLDSPMSDRFGVDVYDSIVLHAEPVEGLP